jgi:hypothetical protein
VAGLVPSSFGSPLREFNKCHDATGKFCSGPRGLTGLRATPCATLHGRMDPAHAMNYDVMRAQQLGISVDVFAGAGSSGSARSLRNSVRVGYPQDRATPVETMDDAYKPSRASDLSVLRHEIGHVTDRGFGMRGDPSEARILGRTYPAWYLMEIGAWKAAVRDAPYNRVQWPRVAKSLRSYPAELMPLPDGWQTAKAHTALLKRYGQVLRRKALIPKQTLDPDVLQDGHLDGSPEVPDAGRRTRTLCGVAVIRHPCQLSTSSTSKRVAILSNNAVRPGCGSRTSRRP